MIVKSQVGFLAGELPCFRTIIKPGSFAAALHYLHMRRGQAPYRFLCNRQDGGFVDVWKIA
jgi:hypothetical protein